MYYKHTNREAYEQKKPKLTKYRLETFNTAFGLSLTKTIMLHWDKSIVLPLLGKIFLFFFFIFCGWGRVQSRLFGTLAVM